MTTDNIRQQLQQLKAFSFHLGESLERTAESLRTSGEIPSAELIAQLQEYCQQFRGLRMRLDLPVEVVLGSQTEAESLDQLEQELDARLARQQADAILARLKGMIHTEGDQHPVIVRCHQMRQSVTELIATGGQPAKNSIGDLNAGTHPLALLERVLARGSDLDDEQWTTCLEQIAAEFGRDVMTAVARQKLRLAN